MPPLDYEEGVDRAVFLQEALGRIWVFAFSRF